MIYFGFLAGAVAGTGAVLIIRRQGHDRQLLLFSVALVIAAAVYAAFSVAGAANGNASLNWIAVEFAGIPLFALFAFSGYKGRPWLVSLGWFLHLFWDFALHGGPGTGFVPDFYPEFCVGFDLVFSAYIAYYFYFRESA